MRKTIDGMYRCIMATLFCCLASAAWAVPANDDFLDAAEIVVDAPLPLTASIDTTGATIEAEETAFDPSLAASVWYKVTAPEDGVVLIDTEGSDFETLLYVWVGDTYAGLALVASDTDSSDGTSLSMGVSNGVEYKIAVYGEGGATGSLNLNLKETVTGSITGNVTAIIGGTALPGIRVEALAYNSYFDIWQVVGEGVSNELGDYIVTGLSAGVPCRVRASDPSGVYAPMAYLNEVLVEDADSVTPDLDVLGVDLALPLAASISGSVADTGATALGGIQIGVYVWSTTLADWVLYATTTTAGDGSFTVNGLPPASYGIEYKDVANSRFFTSYYDEVSDPASASTVAITEGQNLTGYDAALQPTGQIRGTVSSNVDGLPLEGMAVQALVWDPIESEWGTIGDPAISEADGTYWMAGLPYDTYKVVFASLDDASLASVYYGDTLLEHESPVVVLDAGTPVATGIDQTIGNIRMAGILPTGADFTLQFQGNPFTQYQLWASENLSLWESVDEPFFPGFGITDAVVSASVPRQFWKMEGPLDFGLSPQTDIHEQTSYFVTQERYHWADRFEYISGGFLSAFGFGDFNNDGLEDVMAFPGIFLTEVPEPLVLTLDYFGSPSDGSSIFTGGVPGGLHPRKLLLGDLNGDGVDDAVLVDHGYDADPFPGAPLIVMRSQPGGTMVYDEYSELTGFHHAGALGDIDHDGDLDLFLAGVPGLNYPHRLLLNDGLGAFAPVPQLIGPFWDKDIWTSELFDLDGDGFLDLAIGGGTENDPAVVLWGSSSGTYGGPALSLDLPVGWEVYDYDAEDFDDDGDRDLLVTLADTDAEAHLFRLFMNQGNREFVDETSVRFDHPGYGLRWIDFVFVQDTDFDGDLDIVTDVWYVLLEWKNDGDGNFVRQPF